MDIKQVLQTKYNIWSELEAKIEQITETTINEQI